MKLSKLLLLPAFALMTACAQDEDDGPDVIPRSKVDARVNSSLFYPTETQAMLSGEVLTIIGIRSSGAGKASVISMQLKHYKGPNTYRIDTATLASYTDLGVLYTADSGAVVITDINSTKYAGTFGFRATGPGGTVHVREGVIDIYK